MGVSINIKLIDSEKNAANVCTLSILHVLLLQKVMVGFGPHFENQSCNILIKLKVQFCLIICNVYLKRKNYVGRHNKSFDD